MRNKFGIPLNFDAVAPLVTTSPAAGFDEGQPAVARRGEGSRVIQPVFLILADITPLVTELIGPHIYCPKHYIRLCIAASE